MNILDHMQHHTVAIDNHSFVVQMQSAHADSQTCKERRRLRLPMQVRNLYAQIARTSDESERRGLERAAWTL